MPERKSTIVGPLRSPEGHLAFPHLLAVDTGGKFPSGKFDTILLIPRTANTEELVAACVKSAQLEWPDLGITGPLQIKLPIRKGADKPGWEEYLFLKAKSKSKPPIVDARKAPWPGEPKGGDLVRLALSAMPYKQQIDPEIAAALQAQGKLVRTGMIDGKNVSWRPATTFLLNGVQFLRAHPPIGGTGGVDGVTAFQEEAVAATSTEADELFN